jgi:anti-sigma factor RsiW
MNTVMRSLGGSVGGQVGASIIAGSVAASGLPTEHAFTLAFAFAAVVCAGSVVSALAVPAPGRRRAVGEPATASA